MTEWCDRDPTSIALGEGPSKVQQDLGRAFFVIRSRGSRQKNSDNPKASITPRRHAVPNLAFNTSRFRRIPVSGS